MAIISLLIARRNQLKSNAAYRVEWPTEGEREREKLKEQIEFNWIFVQRDYSFFFLAHSRVIKSSERRIDTVMLFNKSS